jgi:hypothetical protein
MGIVLVMGLSADCRICVGKDHIGSERCKFRGRGAGALRVSICEPIFDLDFATVSPTKMLKPLFKCRELGLGFRIIFAKGTQHTNVPNPFAALRERRDRPCNRRATDKREELAPLHFPPVRPQVMQGFKS